MSRLFYAAPDRDLLRELARAPAARSAELQLGEIEDGAIANGYAAAYQTLREACRGADPAAVRTEYDDLFMGAGKALVTLYTSAYGAPHAPDRYLVALREQLASWGLARRDAVFEVEDHVSAICDVMRWLIQLDRPLTVQRGFFDEFVYAALGRFCEAVIATPGASFYRAVAQLARALLAVEHAAFDLHIGE